MRLIKNALVLLLASLLFLSVTGCHKRLPSFPTLGPERTDPAATTNGTAPQPTQTQPADETVYLRLAMPFTQETGEALRLLFLARSSGVLQSQEASRIGHLVSLDDLRQFDGPLVLDVVTVPAATGITAEQIRAWQASAAMPDLLYCNTSAAVPGHQLLLPLNERLYDSEWLSPDQFFPLAAEALKKGQDLYGIPYLASTPLLCHDTDLLTALGARSPAKKWNWHEWRQWMADVQQTLSDQGLSLAPDDLALLAEDDPQARQALLQAAILINSQLTDYLPYIVPSRSSDVGLALWQGTGFSFNHPLLSTSAAWLREMAQAGFATEHLDETDLQMLWSGDSPDRERVISQVVDSAQLADWLQNTGIRAQTSLMPAGFMQEGQLPEANQEQYRLPLHIRSLSIYRDTQHPELSTLLAAFIALDPDSLLMQSRYQLYDGLVPLVRDELVWEHLVSRQSIADQLLGIRQLLPSAYTGGQQTVRSWNKIMTEAWQKGGSLYLSADEEDKEAALQKITETAARILHEEG